MSHEETSILKISPNLVTGDTEEPYLHRDRGGNELILKEVRQAVEGRGVELEWQVLGLQVHVGLG